MCGTCKLVLSVNTVKQVLRAEISVTHVSYFSEEMTFYKVGYKPSFFTTG